MRGRGAMRSDRISGAEAGCRSAMSDAKDRAGRRFDCERRDPSRSRSCLDRELDGPTPTVAFTSSLPAQRAGRGWSLVLDKLLFPQTDPSVWRTSVALAAMSILLYGFIWDAE